MSTIVKYKGSTIATITNQTKTLTTSGKWMEADIVITDINNNYSVTLNLTGATSSATGTSVANGGSYFTKLTPTTAGHKISSVTVTMGGVDITSQVFNPGVGAKVITSNGTYNASSDNLSGYDTITVNVSSV